MSRRSPHSKNEKHAAQWLRTLELAAFPHMGKIPVHAIQQADILRALNPIWMAKPETARRVKQRIGAVLDWATAEGLREGVNPVVGISRGLPKQKDKADHFTALPWKDLPDLFPRIEAVEGMGALALRFAILTAVRSGDVRGATWAEIDMDGAVWTIPAARIKAGVEHRVPLSAPALRVVEAVRGLSTGLAFPSRQHGKPLSDMTLAAVLKRLEVPVTVHGFGSTFRDWAEEATSYPHEVKEAALAHAVKSKTERV